MTDAAEDGSYVSLKSKSAIRLIAIVCHRCNACISVTDVMHANCWAHALEQTARTTTTAAPSHRTAVTAPAATTVTAKVAAKRNFN